MFCLNPVQFYDCGENDTKSHFIVPVQILAVSCTHPAQIILTVQPIGAV